MSIANKITTRIKQFDESLQSKVLNYINSLAESNGIMLKQDVVDHKEIADQVIKVVDQYRNYFLMLRLIINFLLFPKGFSNKMANTGYD